MKVHSDIIILEILILYFEYTNETEIDLKMLEKSFHILTSIINYKNNLDLRFDFKNELENFLEKYSDYITENDNTLTLTSELKDLFNAVIDSHSILSTIDGKCQDYIFDYKIYQALGISIPIEETKEYFDLNRDIIKAYLKLGENEYHSYFDELAITKLKELIAELNEKLNEADNSTLTKLKICYNALNDTLLAKTDEEHINSAWNTILFSYIPQRLYSLSYDRVEYLVEIIDKNTGDEEDEETLNNVYNTEHDEENEQLSPVSYFLTIVLIELNNYLKNNQNSPTKEALLIKKYLLIGIPELQHVERYYLENYTIDGYEPPIPEDLDANSFEHLKKKVIECTTTLVKNNNELTKPHILANVITSALFIKVFLDIGLNPDSHNDIIDLITSSAYYKQPGYEVITTIIDEIILSDNESLTR